MPKKASETPEVPSYIPPASEKEKIIEKIRKKGIECKPDGTGIPIFDTKLQDLPEAHSNIVRTASESEKQENSSLFTLHSSLPSGYAVIFGNEVKGVKQNIVDMSDGCLEIPQFGTKHSLNVSVTAGIVVWEFAKLLKL